MTKKETRIEVRAALYRDTDTKRWVARGLKFDVIGEGDNALEALHHLILAIEAEMNFADADGRKPFEGLSRTPAGFLKWWDARSTRKMNSDDIATLAPFESPRRMKLAMETESRAAM